MLKFRLLGIFVVILGFMCTQYHVLSLLILLELLILNLLLLLFAVSNHLVWFLVLLTVAACEAALGLSLLVGMLRLRGNDRLHYLASNIFFV